MLRALSIAWRVIVGLLSLGVAFTLLRVASSDFEKIVVAALILIYASVIASFQFLVYMVAAGDMAGLHRFMILLRHLDREVADEDKEHLQDLDKRMAQAVVLRAINGVVAWIMAIGAIVQIVAVALRT